MNKLKANLLLPLFTFLIITSTYSQIAPKSIDSLVEDAMKKFNVVGVAVMIVKDGKVIHLKGYGVQSITTNEKADQNTNFCIGSTSKAFTTAALSILEDEGKIGWNDKVIKCIPEFKMYNDYVTENFTIEDLLTHRSGLGSDVGDLMGLPDDNDFTIKDVVTSFQYFKPATPFRTHFDYDNLLYLVAGEVIARVSGMSYADFVQKRIMQPLQMNNSYAAVSMLKSKRNVASPHSAETGTIRVIATFEDKINSACGGIWSNVADLSKWLLVHLNKGKYGSDLKTSLFSEKNQQEMWQLHTIIKAESIPRYNTHFYGYGLGWDIEDKKGNLSVSHTGGGAGMLCKISMIPDLNLGVVVLTNTENGGGPLFNAVTNTIIDSYLGLENYGWVDKYLKKLNDESNNADQVTKKIWATVEKAKNMQIKNEDYIGIYEDKWFGKTEVFLKENHLWFKCYRSPKLNGRMFFYQANTFAVKWEYQDMNCDALTMFSLDENGKATSIKLKGISPNMDSGFDFQDLDLQRIEK
jgi:CubicO group peptidase (beta-lactamase class C family)